MNRLKELYLDYDMCFICESEVVLFVAAYKTVFHV